MSKFNGMAVMFASSGRFVPLDFAFSLASFQYPVGMSSIYLKATGSDRGAQRQALLERAIEIGAEYAIFLDDDTVCPAATMQQLHYVLANTPNAAICGGIYCTKTPIPMPIVFQEIGGGPFYDWTLGD